MEELSHYQKYKDTIYKNVVKSRKKAKLEKIKQDEELMKTLKADIIKDYLKQQIEIN
jgi:hypothetical protein